MLSLQVKVRVEGCVVSLQCEGQTDDGYVWLCMERYWLEDSRTEYTAHLRMRRAHVTWYLGLIKPLASLATDCMMWHAHSLLSDVVLSYQHACFCLQGS